MSLPIRLKQDTILEAVAEIRFLPQADDVAAVLPGFLRASLPDLSWKLERMPLSEVPPSLRSKTDLRYQSNLRLVGENWSIQVADQALGLSSLRPYVGWRDFKSLCLKVFGSVLSGGLISEIERASVKYINLLPNQSAKEHLGMTRLSVSAPDRDFRENSLSVRFETKRDDLLAIVQILTHATATQEKSKDDKSSFGVVMDIDVIARRRIPPELDALSTALEDAHTFEKQIYFGLLDPKVLESYGPEYGQS
jgi:uncharacterized protein (TIGR04255 family)